MDGTFITKLIFGLHTAKRTQNALQIDEEKSTPTPHETCTILKRKFHIVEMLLFKSNGTVMMRIGEAVMKLSNRKCN